MRSRFFFTAATAAIALFSVSLSAIAPPAAAQSAPCGGSTQPEKLKVLKTMLAEMSTNDPDIVNRNLKQATEELQKARLFARGNGLVESDLKKNKGMQMLEDRLEFWRQKKARLELGGMVDVRAGGMWASYLHAKIDELQSQIVGTWNWWNGYTVTFNANGGASYRGTALTRSGVGRWQHAGGSTYHIHWLTANTNDNVTLSSDGMRLEGVYDGKPGTSTRKC